MRVSVCGCASARVNRMHTIRLFMLLIRVFDKLDSKRLAGVDFPKFVRGREVGEEVEDSAWMRILPKGTEEQRSREGRSRETRGIFQGTCDRTLPLRVCLRQGTAISSAHSTRISAHNASTLRRPLALPGFPNLAACYHGSRSRQLHRVDVDVGRRESRPASRSRRGRGTGGEGRKDIRKRVEHFGGRASLII